MEKQKPKFFIFVNQKSHWFSEIMSKEVVNYRFSKKDYTLSCDIFSRCNRFIPNTGVFFLIFVDHQALPAGVLGTLLTIDREKRTLQIAIDDRDVAYGSLNLDERFLSVCQAFHANQEFIADYDGWDVPIDPDAESELSPHMQQKLRSLDRRLYEMRSDALHSYQRILEDQAQEDHLPDNYLNSLHGCISQIKRKTLDLHTTKYESFDGVFNSYYQTFLSNSEQIKNEKYRAILQDECLSSYIQLFLERDFYRHIIPLSREKVGEDLTEIYFGSNYKKNHTSNIKALFIQTRYYQKSPRQSPRWESHYTQIKNVEYRYYSIGHLLSEGIVMDGKRIFFDRIEDFYHMEDLTETPDEKKFLDCYLDYIAQFDDKKDIPLLIPQFRFDKEKLHHKYRLDFLIMNYNTYPAKKIGIELSRRQTHINEEDRKKRNDFFERYRITVLEFTDEELGNIQQLFQEKIVPYLQVQP